MHTIEDRRILITGGAGFVGSHLARRLTPQNDVHVVDNLSAGAHTNVPERATFHRADIRDPDVLERLTYDVDLVFHEAAVVSVARSVEDPPGVHETNTDATLHLLELARQRDFRIVLASSAAVYGHPDTVPITETAPKTPTSPYGVDKLTVDHYARLYNDLYGVETVSLRYFNIYGPGQTGGDYAAVIPIFCDQALSDEPITINGDGSQTRDFVYISDVVDANLHAATTDAVGEAFNIGTGTATSIINLATTIREVAGSTSELTYTDPRPGDIDESVADITKARQALEYDPTVSLQDGLQRMIEHRQDS
jgi:UDP-glucose 4-epimerase